MMCLSTQIKQTRRPIKYPFNCLAKRVEWRGVSVDGIVDEKSSLPKFPKQYMWWQLSVRLICENTRINKSLRPFEVCAHK